MMLFGFQTFYPGPLLHPDLLTASPICGLKWFFVFAMMIPCDLHTFVHYMFLAWLVIVYSPSLIIVCWCVLDIISNSWLQLATIGHDCLVWVFTITDFYGFPAPTPQRLRVHLQSSLLDHMIPVKPLVGCFFNYDISGYVLKDAWTLGSTF